MSLEITLSDQERLSVGDWVEKQLQDRSEKEGFNYPVSKIGTLICTYLLPTLSSLFSELYDSTFSSDASSFEDANVFLLPEFHSPESSWRQLNGRFITHLSQFHPLIVFVESQPSMKSLNDDAESFRCEFQIQSPGSDIDFIGWDLNDPIMEKIESMLVLIDKIDEEVDEKINLCNGKTKKEICLKKREIEKLRNDRNKLTDDLLVLVGNTFPARTQAMVSTLQACKKGAVISGQPTKFVFIAGAAHLIEEESKTKEFCLETLNEELRHHNAVVMIPSVCDLYQT